MAAMMACQCQLGQHPRTCACGCAGGGDAGGGDARSGAWPGGGEERCVCVCVRECMCGV